PLLRWQASRTAKLTLTARSSFIYIGKDSSREVRTIQYIRFQMSILLTCKIQYIVRDRLMILKADIVNNSFLFIEAIPLNDKESQNIDVFYVSSVI
ncbi:MAG TPA: hypothetical protein DDW86_03970, partial [Clostridiales bacterium]|nr:hypothetical protein [Clostridiales bacterium]